MQYAALAALLHEVIEGQGDADALATLLDHQISLSPQDPQLYAIRAQLNDACGYRGPAWRDLQQAAALAPADREAALALVGYQCRHASRLAWSLSDDEEEDEDAIEAHGSELEAQAVTGLWRLMRDYASDAGFALRLCSVLEENHVWRPWDRYRLVLTALAANPGDWALRKKEAMVLAWLASVGPETDDIDVIPAGYYADWHGDQLHALGTERALAAIGMLLLERTDAELLTEQARLLTTLERFDEAAAIHASLIALYEEQLVNAATAEREELLQCLAGAQENHANCAAGRSAYLDSQEAILAGAISELVKLTGGKRVEGLKTNAQAWRNDAEAVQRGPDRELKAELNRVAKVIAGQTVAMLSEPPVSLRSQAPEDIAGEISPWFAELAPGLQLAGLTMATGFENPNYAGRFGWHQGQLWAHQDGRLALIAECVPGIRLARVMSRFSDGTILLTAASLGTSMFSAGPRVDMFCVLPDTPVNEMIALHGARLARRLAAEPALSALLIRNVPQLVQAENDMLTLKNAFRRAVGLTDYEIRGMHVQHHDYFAQVVKAEVTALLEAGA